VVDRKVVDGRVEYLLQWEGVDGQDWVLASNVKAPSLIKAFLAEQRNLKRGAQAVEESVEIGPLVDSQGGGAKKKSEKEVKGKMVLPKNGPSGATWTQQLFSLLVLSGVSSSEHGGRGKRIYFLILDVC
jgi:hypothetical protein